MTYIPYLFYLMRQQRSATAFLAVDVLFLVVALLALHSALNSPTGTYVLTATVVFAVGKAAWSVIKIFRSWMAYLHASESRIIRRRALNQSFGLVKLTQIRPSEKEQVAGFSVHKTCREPVLHSEQIDEFLWTAPQLRVVKNTEKPLAVARLIRRHRGPLLTLLACQHREARKEKQLFFNEEKLCLASRIDPDRGQVECYKGLYFDALLTNEACTKALVDENDDDLLTDFTPMFPLYRRFDNQVCLDDIAESAMSDHIGISTLGFTRDRYIVIWAQSPKVLHSPGLLAPTGSGSCDWKDLVSYDDFLHTIRIAMERELREESSLKMLSPQHPVINSTFVLGFFRWVKRGGNPEFVGITRLDVDSSELKPNLSETRRPREKRQAKFLVEKIDDLHSLRARIERSGELSVPLDMNLRCLEEFYSKRGQQLADFLYGADH